MGRTSSNAQIRRHLRRRRDTARGVARQLLGAANARPLDAVESMRLDDSLEELEFTGRLLRELKPAKRSSVKVKSEPPIYGEHGRASFFLDLLSAQSPTPVPGIPAHEARDRLLRNTEAEQGRRQVNRLLAERALQAAGVQARDLSATTTGSGAEFVPPQWILSEWATIARSASPLRRLARAIPLPNGTMEIHVPRIDAAAGVATEATENTPAASTAIATTDETTTPVRIFFGDLVVSQQLLDRSVGFDQIVLADMAASFAAALETELVNGSGSGGHLLGLRNVTTATTDGVPGARAVTYTTATPTVAKFVTAVGQTAAAVSTYRKRPPSALLMNPRRFFWLASEADSTGEPILRPGGGPSAVPTDADTGPFGPLVGLPVFLDDTVPVNLGATTNEDTVLAIRPADFLLMESEPVFTTITDGATLAPNLSAALAWHCYVAFTPQRYPSSIGRLTGTGLKMPSGF